MTRIGIIFTPDNASEADLWRWAPPGVTLHFTRTPFETLIESPGASWCPTDRELTDATRTFTLIRPAVTTLACTSGSFIGGLEDEERIRRTISAAGGSVAQTTSGALLDALDVLGVRAVAVATPYDETTTARLGAFLGSAGYTVASLINDEPPTPEDLSRVAADDVIRLARAADRPDADALFVSCAALETYDLISTLERDLSKPVITSGQVTMWAALGAAGVDPNVADQMLMRQAWRRSVRSSSDPRPQHLHSDQLRC
jgi:maleate isomerase